MERKLKYDYAFKLECVELVLKKHFTSVYVSKLKGLDESNIRKWVNFYKSYGDIGLLPKKNQSYSIEFKLRVIKTIQKELLSLRAASLRFNVPDTAIIVKWKKDFANFGLEGLQPKQRGRPISMSDYKRKKRKSDKPLTREEELLKENERLRCENELLKKLQALVQAREKSQAIIELRHKFELELLLDLTNMARSSFYYQQKQRKLPDKYKELKELIKAIYHRHKGRYGYRRITDELQNKGIVINHKTVLRLMKLLGLKSIIRVKKYTSYRGKNGKIAPNILERNFKAEAPNQKWATDITEFNVSGNKLYLSPIIDLFNQEIISYELTERPVFNQVVVMLKKAFKKIPNNTNLILHSDQGWQYQMSHYQHILKEKGITQSMSRKGNCLDNAVIENFFGILKSEMFYTQKFKSIEQLKKEIDQYIFYYNNERIKSNLNKMSPIKYRAHYYQN